MLKKYNTWETLKELTEYEPKYKGSNEQRFFMEITDEDEPIFCFLRPSCGSFEFRLFRTWDDNFICDNPILYPDSSWIEVSKQDADIFLKGNYEII